MKPALYWRHRAEEIRAMRDDMKDPRPRAIMSRIAADYERMAIARDGLERETLMTRLAWHYAELTDYGHAHE